MVQLLQNLPEEGNTMTDTQVIRKKLSQACISSLEKRINKSRISQDDIKNIILSEVTKVIRDEY